MLVNTECLSGEELQGAIWLKTVNLSGGRGTVLRYFASIGGKFGDLGEIRPCSSPFALISRFYPS